MVDSLLLEPGEWTSPAAVGVGELPRHRWYFVKEGFSPSFVSQVLQTEEVLPGELLMDPFSGGGTVPLVGVMAGVRVETCEVNPFLHFLSTAKLLTAGAGELLRSGEIVLRTMEQPVTSPLEGVSTFTEGNRWGRWLFPLSAIRAFEAGRRALLLVQDGRCRALLKLALIGAAMDACNATRDGKCLRFRPGWRDREATAGQVRARFEARFREMGVDIDRPPLRGVAARLIRGDAREKIGASKEKFRLCITSPPYLNSFDYSDVYRPELFLGDFVASTNDLMKIRLRTIRSHVQAKWEMPTRSDFGALYRKCIDDLGGVSDRLWDKRLLLMIQAYFEDMAGVLARLRARASRSASLWLVVSTSAYGGVEVPVDGILAEMGQQEGWFLRELEVVRYLRSSSQHVENGQSGKGAVRLRESLLVFDACERR